MIVGTIISIVTLPYVVTAVVSFVVGVLVGRRNGGLVNTIIADTKTLESKVVTLEQKIVALTEKSGATVKPVVVVTTPVTTPVVVSAVTGSV